jgi:L-asparagine transporter-like permease
MNIGHIVGIVAAAGILAAHLIVVHSCYRKAKSARERQFVSRASIVLFVYLFAILAALLISPHIRPVIFAPLAMISIIGIGYWKRRQSLIRQEEQTR